MEQSNAPWQCCSEQTCSAKCALLTSDIVFELSFFRSALEMYTCMLFRMYHAFEKLTQLTCLVVRVFEPSFINLQVEMYVPGGVLHVQYFRKVYRGLGTAGRAASKNRKEKAAQQTPPMVLRKSSINSGIVIRIEF